MEAKQKGVQSTMTRVGEVLVSIVAVIYCCTIIGMAWGIPMLIGNGKRKRGEKPVTIAHAIIAFLFFGWIAGLLIILGGDVK